MHQDMYVKALALYLLILVTAAYQPLNFTEMKPPSVGSGSMIRLPVEGNVYPTGSYTTRISIGTNKPPKEFVFDIDNGSDLTWVPCVGTQSPYYDPEHEPGNSIVMCSDPECKALGGDDSNCDRASNRPCTYTIKYVDGASSTGALFKDSFHLELSNRQLVTQRIAFGCSQAPKDAVYGQTFKGGILGLGKGPPGILHQLSKPGVNVIRDVVGHCLSSTGGGFIFLGNCDNLPRNMVWKQLLRRSGYYSLGSADLVFDGRSVGSVKGLQIIFDSGSTYTYFNSYAYSAVAFLIHGKLQGFPGSPVNLDRGDNTLPIFVKLQGLPRRPVNLDRGDKTLPICWKGPQPFGSISDAAKYFPNFALSFAPNVQLYLSPRNYLIISKPAGNACLGILNGTVVGLGNMNVIGDISMQDKWIVYDNENARVGWAGVPSCVMP